MERKSWSFITDSKAQVEKTELVTKIIFVVNVV